MFRSLLSATWSIQIDKYAAFVSFTVVNIHFCIGLSRYIAITTFSIIAVIAAFCRISPSILNRFKPNLQAQ